MSEELNKGIAAYPLFVGLTRPTTLFGLPLSAFVFNMVVIAVLFLATKNVFLILLAIPSHFILRFMTNKDIFIFDNLRLEGITKGRCRNKKNGIISFSALDVRKLDYKNYED